MASAIDLVGPQSLALVLRSDDCASHLRRNLRADCRLAPNLRIRIHRILDRPVTLHAWRQSCCGWAVPVCAEPSLSRHHRDDVLDSAPHATKRSDLLHHLRRSPGARTHRRRGAVSHRKARPVLSAISCASAKAHSRPVAASPAIGRASGLARCLPRRDLLLGILPHLADRWLAIQRSAHGRKAPSSRWDYRS